MLAAEAQKCKGADAAENEDFSLRPLRLCGELGGFADLLQFYCPAILLSASPLAIYPPSLQANSKAGCRRPRSRYEILAG